MVKECAAMLEKYVSSFPAEKGCVWLLEKDMQKWKDVYYPKLVQSGPQLPDDKFFGTEWSNLGIGNDGIFSGYELFQFMYRLYKEIAGAYMTDINKIMEHAELLSCAAMLEKYVSRFPAETGCARFEDEDMEQWKSTYYKNLVQSGPYLLDDKFFGSDWSHLGIGNDGIFSGYDLFQFMYRLYKEIAQKLR